MACTFVYFRQHFVTYCHASTIVILPKEGETVKSQGPVED